MIRLYISIDRWLNRILLLLIAAAIVVVIIDEFDNSVPYPPIPRGAMNTSPFFSVLQSTCSEIDVRIKYFQTCADELASDPDGIRKECSAVSPAGVDLTPSSAVLARSVVRTLESRKASLGCRAQQNADGDLALSEAFMEAIRAEDDKAPIVDLPKDRPPGLSDETEAKSKEIQNDQN